MKFFLILTLIFSTFMNAQTKIIAHRGFWNTQPKTSENSIKALENAQRLKIYGSEFDVRMTKDGILVINHDEHHGKMEISETDFSDLRKLKLSNGEKLPTLKDYLKQGKKEASVSLEKHRAELGMCSQQRMPANLELVRIRAGLLSNLGDRFKLFFQRLRIKRAEVVTA